MALDYSSYLPYALLALGLAAYGIYRTIMPKPVPGIPYGKNSMRPFGDIPALMRSVKETGEMGVFLKDRGAELGTNVFQVFINPLGKPMVCVADPLATEDVLAHRLSEFELSPMFSSLFSAVIPDSMMCYETRDPKWKIHRRMMGDTMANKFLHGVAGDNVVTAAQDLVELWNEKIRLGQGRAFEVTQDTADLLMESTWASAFGDNLGMTRSNKKFLANLDQLPESAIDGESAIKFPLPPISEQYQSVYLLAESSEIALKSPLRAIAHKWALITDPALRKANKFRHDYINDKLNDAWKRFTSEEKAETKCVTDLLVEKEVFLSGKEQRPPQHLSTAVQHEAYTFLLGGYDTTSTTSAWALKLLTRNQDAQSKLREELQRTFGDNKAPKTADLIGAYLPYLESVIYEILRVGNTAVFLNRVTTCDVEILGHRIPKGTEVAFPVVGLGYHSERLPSTTDLKNPYTGNWNPKELHLFKPERWLTEVDGQLKFDNRAGPMHTFGIGTRSCFGKRLALLGMQAILTTIILNFELHPVSDELMDFKPGEGQLDTQYRCRDVLTHHPRQVYVRPVKI